MYGFRKGDEIIKLTSCLLEEIAQPELDFVGHIGGDDFIVLFRSQDWEARCRTLMNNFAAEIPTFYEAHDIARGGVEAEDRQGRRTLHPMSIGAVWVTPRSYSSHHQVAAAASAAKKMAKKSGGDSLFIERRNAPPHLQP